MNFRQTRLNEIRQELDKLDSRRYFLLEEREGLEKAEAKEKYNCPCVRLNGDMGIHDMIQQESFNRRGLQFGTVSRTLSCEKDCLRCKGKGIPQ
jgi:chorismate mutase